MPEITFKYIGDYAYNVCEKPRPAQSFIPEWFRQMESYEKSPENPDGTRLLVRSGDSNATAKKCTPMLDGITSGYIVPLWTDVQITSPMGEPFITWRTQRDVFQPHGSSGSRITTPEGFNKNVYKYLTWFRAETPPGYSIMITPPAGHYDLPFHVIPAIIDSDKSVIDTNIPLWIKDGFDGIVEKGTPVAQITPFKRESWSSKFDVMTDEKFFQERDSGFSSTIKHNYIKNIWSRKSYK